MALPEHSGPAECYYDKAESSNYHRNSRISKIQRDMTVRALELLAPERGDPILDIACGSGLSGSCIEARGHEWIGIDISPSMLEMAHGETAAAGLLCADMGAPLPLKPESISYAISISALQWLFQSYTREHEPRQRIRCFFRSLNTVVRVRAVIQFYCSPRETELLRRAAVAAGFYAAVVTDDEGTKHAKTFLVLDKFKQAGYEALNKETRDRKKEQLKEKKIKRAKME